MVLRPGPCWPALVLQGVCVLFEFLLHALCCKWCLITRGKMSGKPLPLPAVCARKMGKRVCREPCSVDLQCDSEVVFWFSKG
ncbi:hypothetical protein AV530_004658 [Patagioenas fasciata monilis]|uniref:Uncharacterized protein n=1 Tax=Patagioenas fasciata monilis TaxID=372326 RepID=A0A1V4KHR8_PATFA|nr:hypothetical protein AV530_004658 [Patagioenas fasciata monilis]